MENPWHECWVKGRETAPAEPKQKKKRKTHETPTDPEKTRGKGTKKRVGYLKTQKWGT